MSHQVDPNLHDCRQGVKIMGSLIYKL